MPFAETVIAVAIHLLVPLGGVGAFFYLCWRMRQSRITSPPFLTFFILFATFGSWLLVFLTALFWHWSGMASLGTLYLVFIAPFVTGALAWRLHKRRQASRFHRCAYILSLGYVPLMLLGILLFFSLRHFAFR